MMSFGEMVKVFRVKVYTVLVDRRAWAVGAVYALLALLGFFGLVGGAHGEIMSAFTQVYDSGTELAAAVIKFAEALLVFYMAILPIIKLVGSWTERPPSGQVIIPPKH